MKSKAALPPAVRFVNALPDLMTGDDYRAAGTGGRKVRVQLTLTATGLEIVADSLYVATLEELLAAVGSREVSRVLCG